ncbi:MULTISPECIES: tetratricopeptide repeat protein [Nonomuraea]|uniref:Tetratricopeptide repeat protein n=1 Tax=Nonomuraea ferruginea TaxID=46174 RepID=A0ABT4SVR1_9ACTN|nr:MULTISPECIES: tetratricopeptide repeat protein [Nonomuraea]MDA0641353.1 tetratricopeptide repeat protein [Nonomuraea ferruginea]
MQSSHALNQAQQAAQQSGIQYNIFIGADQARSVAATAPPIVVPQLKIASQALRGRAELLEHAGDFIGMPRPGVASEPRVMVLYGLGGVGKTTLALELAHRAIRANHQVWWVPADDVESMRSALYALAFSLGARDEDFDHAHPSDVLWRYLNSLDHAWLLVIDNADDPAALGSSSGGVQEGTQWLRPPASHRNGVIISSRNGRPERWASWIRMCHVPPLTSEAGARVLADLAPRAGDEQEAVALSGALGGVPLALELAGRYLAAAATDPFPGEDTHTSFNAYRINFDTRLGHVDMPAGSSGESARRALTTTWEISLDLLERQGHDLARPLLRLLSCCGVSPVPYRAVIRPEVLADTTLFPRPTAHRIGSALRALDGLGLISLDLAPRTQVHRENADPWESRLTMHPLVRTVTRQNLQRQGVLVDYLAVLAVALDKVTATIVPDNAHHWPRWSLLASHCTAPLELMAQLEIRDAGLVSTFLPAAERAAWYRYMAGHYLQASIDYALLLDVAEKAIGPASAEALSIGNNRARAIRDGGDNARARAMLRELLAAALGALGSDHPTVLGIRLNLGRTLRESGDVAGAEAELRALLDDSRRVLGEQHSDTIATALNLGVCLRLQDRFAEAEAVYRQVLSDWRQAHAADDLTTLDIRFELAETMRHQGDFAQAEAELRDLVTMATRVYGEDHPNTLIIRRSLAAVLRSSGSLEAADVEFREVLRLQRGKLGAEHPLTRATEAALEAGDAS